MKYERINQNSPVQAAKRRGVRVLHNSTTQGTLNEGRTKAKAAVWSRKQDLKRIRRSAKAR